MNLTNKYKRKMKKIFAITLIVLLTSCSGILTKKDVFIGDWVMVQNSSYCYKITKEEIFYKVDFMVDGKSFYGDLANDVSYPVSYRKSVIKSLTNYQLSNDKRTLTCIGNAKEVIVFNEDNNTITTSFGWFKRK
jgi:hypothetical protein